MNKMFTQILVAVLSALALAYMTATLQTLSSIESDVKWLTKAIDKYGERLTELERRQTAYGTGY